MSEIALGRKRYRMETHVYNSRSIDIKLRLPERSEQKQTRELIAIFAMVKREKRCEMKSCDTYVSDINRKKVNYGETKGDKKIDNEKGREVNAHEGR